MGAFRYDLIPRASAVLCAVSGGADSMYLLCRLLEGARTGGYTVKVAHYDHNLRPASGRDADFVRDWCRRRGVPLTVGSGDVAVQAKRRGLGVEECARQMRYAFLERTAKEEKCDFITTGHHAGDNAETVLMNLIRGCGLKGLTGIPERRGNIIRPMLAVDRAEIEAYLSAHGVPHVEDESNGELDCTRNRLRHQVLPLLEELNPRAARHIVQAAAALREDEQELSGRACRLADGEGRETASGWAIPARSLLCAPRPVALRAAALLLERAGLGRERVHLELALELAAHGAASSALDVPGGRVRREYDELVFERRGRAAPLPELPLSPGEQRWGGWRVTCAPAVCPDAPGTPDSFYLAPGEYVIRPRRQGDALRPPNRVRKSLKKWMIDEKIPRDARERVPVLARDGQAAAAGGIGVDAAFLARPGEPALHIILTEERE